MNENGRQRLADAVKRDRRRKYRTVERARAAAGLSRGAWDNVEKARPVKEVTLTAVEEALEWRPGTAERLLSGDDVVPSGLSLEVEEGLARLTPDQADQMRAVLLRDLEQRDEGRRSG